MIADALLHRVTAEEYHLMGENGAIAREARVELLDGKIIDKFPIGPFHSGTVTRLNSIFERASRDRWLTSVQNPLRLGRFDEPQPDIVLLKPRDDFYTEKIAVAEDALLLIEVSDSSIGYDRKDKLPVYARAGVREVWLINVQEKKVEVYRAPRQGAYGEAFEARPGEALSPELFPDVAIDLKALFRV